MRRLDLAQALAGEDDADAVHGRILEAVGRAEPLSRSDELYWAIRRLLETLARERPRPRSFSTTSSGRSPPSLTSSNTSPAGAAMRRSSCAAWLGRSLPRSGPAWPTLPLRPLSQEESEALLGTLAGPLDPASMRELGRATGGNPLFLQEMFRMLEEEQRLFEQGGKLVAQLDSLRVPETIQAVLAARLDRLTEYERDTLQRASVIGQVFFWGAVAELAPPDRVAAVAGDLQALVRKGLVKPDRRTLAGEDGFRFAHILVRDAAYDSTSKRSRGELHERFADWLETRAGEREDLDEIIGHHLEQAHAYRIELAPAGDVDAALAGRAANRLARAGRRALARGDAHAAAGLLGRAAAFLPGDAALLLDHADAIAQLGSIVDAEERFGAALRTALAAGDRRSEVLARLELGMIGFLSRAESGAGELAAEVERALPAFEAAGDDQTVARLLRRLADAYWWRCQIVAMQDALERALVHTRRAGDERQAADVAVRLGFAAVVGPLPVEDGRRFVADALAQTEDETSSKGMLLLTGALLAALEGDFAAARDLSARGTEILDGLGRSIGLAAITTWTAAIDLLAGEIDRAEHDLKAALAHLDAAGHQANAASVAAQLAETLVAAGRYEEADELTLRSEAASSRDDIHAQIAWRVARAKAAAGLGRSDAEQIAREAVALAYETDSPFYTADALDALAVALDNAGHRADASATARDALGLYEAKGNLVAVDRIRAWAAAERTASTSA